MPTVSANRNASCLYSSVYLRFGTGPLAIAFSVHQNIIKILMYVETGQGQLVDVGGQRRGVHGAVELAAGQRLDRILPGKQPTSVEHLALGPRHPPPTAQPLEQHRR